MEYATSCRCPRSLQHRFSHEHECSESIHHPLFRWSVRLLPDIECLSRARGFVRAQSQGYRLDILCCYGCRRYVYGVETVREDVLIASRSYIRANSGQWPNEQQSIGLASDRVRRSYLRSCHSPHRFLHHARGVQSSLTQTESRTCTKGDG